MEGGMWWIIIGAIVAVVVAGIILFIVKGGLSAGGKNIDALASCTNQGGHCEGVDPTNNKPKCSSTESSYYKFGGCSGNTLYCCIPK